MPRLIAVILVLGAFLALSRPAAADTGTLTLAESPNYTGPCPVTQHFSGSIVGPAGSAVTYHFASYTGTWSYTSDLSTTIPANGTLPVANQLVVDQAHSGFQSYELQIVAPSNGNDLTKAKVFFTVTCSSGTPSSPAPSRFRLGSGVPNMYSLTKIPMPENLKSTTDPHQCAAHGGFAGLFCMQAVPDQYLILVWDWEPNAKWPSIDGYHIYDVTGGGKTRVQDQTNQQTTVEFFKPGSFAGKCYAVSAYKGASESVLSASFCAAQARVGVRTSSLSPSAAESHYHEYCRGLCGVPSCATVVCLGWTHSTQTGHFNNYQRGYLQFDQGQIAGRNVYSAKLSIRWTGGAACYGGIGTPNGPWVGTPEDTVTPATLDPSIQSTMTDGAATFDLTSLVRGWARGEPNYGVVLFSTNENTGAEDNGYCHIQVTQAALGIKSY